MELLYFDFDHGVERLLFVTMDREALSVHFRFEQSPDATYEDEGPEVPVVSVRASTKCSSVGELFGFFREVTAAMRQTPFRLQDPTKKPFAAMPHEALVLDDVGDGAQVACTIPPEIADEVWPTKRDAET
ncbi:MAG TPA: hypothetical protein VGH28_10885 [Polyangiaceae bacterium]|jgi:hypothetical protein